MAELVVLGSGAGFATPDRFSTSIALLEDESVYLLDVGEPCAALLFRHGIDPLAVRGIFVSHMHPDHVGGLAPVLFSMYLPGRSTDGPRFREWSVSTDSPWYRDHVSFPADPPERAEDGRYGPVSLHVPTEAVEAMRVYLPSVYLAPEILPFPLDISGVAPGEIYADGSVSVDALANTHLSANAAYQELPTLYPHMALESYSYGVTVGGTRVVYSGDITALAELSPLLPSADVLIIEIAHFDPNDLPDGLSDVDASVIILTHVHPGLEARLAEVVERWGDDRVIVAHDGLRISL